MFILDNMSKKILKESVKSDIGINLTEFYASMNKVLREDANETDLSGFQNRCNWFLGKIVNDRNSLLKYAELDQFKNIFKNVNISETDDKISLTVENNEVNGNTRLMAITYLITSFSLLINLQTIGEKFEEVGGSLIKKFSETLSLELGKRCDLSEYGINGDIIRVLCKSLHNTNPLINIFTVLTMMLLLKQHDKTIDSILLLMIRIIKTQPSNTVGYMYVFIDKTSNILEMKLDYLKKDIYFQMKAII